MTVKQLCGNLKVKTEGEGFTDITESLNHWIKKERILNAILNITCLHTSCSLTINENADPRVLNDLSAYMQSIVSEDGVIPIGGNSKTIKYKHCEEGKDDMPAHIRTSLTSSSLGLSIQNGILNLGTWQAVYLWEHRHLSHERKLALHAIGEIKTKSY